MEKIFNLIDQDSDGKILSKDIKTALHACGYAADKIEVDAYAQFVE